MSQIKAHFKTLAEFQNAVLDDENQFVYARGAHPTVEKFNSAIAKMENKETALSFASGTGAMAACLFSLLKSGDHVLYNDRSYSSTRQLLSHHLPRLGVAVTALTDSQVPDLANHIRPETRLVILESPTYFDFGVLEFGSLAKVAKEKNIITLLDNTYLGPGNLKAHVRDSFDIILHSAIKIISGYGAALGGVICLSKKLRTIIFNDGLMALGSVMTPETAEKMLNGLETYHERTQKIKNEIKLVVQFLRSHNKISFVNYPWTEKTWDNHPDYNFPVGLLSFELSTDNKNQIKKFCDGLKLIKLGVSYGSTEALMMPALAFDRPGQAVSSPGKCRLSIGEQSGKSIVHDLQVALNLL